MTLPSGRPALESFTLLLSIVIIVIGEDFSWIRSEGGKMGPPEFCYLSLTSGRESLFLSAPIVFVKCR